MAISFTPFAITVNSMGAVDNPNGSALNWYVQPCLDGSERGGCSPLREFELLSDRHPDPAKFAKSFIVWPLHSDLREQFGHLLQVLQKTSE